MLRHIGNKRGFRHNLRLAILLCLAAGFINAAGFLAFSVLTTNVTGHAALLAVYLATDEWRAARMVALWLVLFLAGAFTSSVYIRKAGADNPYAYSPPVIGIVLVLLFVVFRGKDYDGSLVKTEYFAGSLLFVMGMQNALVSIISGALVRTTHLTGMVTDLGIDLSEVFFSGGRGNVKLQRRIVLRLAIIFFFLLGGILGGILFNHFKYIAFLVPVLLLMIVLVYDYFRVRLIRRIRLAAGRKV